jgi:phosphoribosylanthranilate isomerase
MKVKVCGITNLYDALVCEKEGADALGFIFYSKSKRNINPDEAALIINKLSPFTTKVGVFVNEKSEIINEIVNKTRINIIQLHGDEDENYCAEMKLPVIKTFRINDDFDFEQVNKYKNVNYLFDSYSEDSFGGTGKSFNWEMIPRELKSQIILSGGINEINIEKLFYGISPAAIDVLSSLESEPGKKDENKVRSFFRKFNSLR